MNYPRVFDDGFHLWTVDEDERVMFACGRKDGSFAHMDSICSLQDLTEEVDFDSGVAGRLQNTVELEELV